MKKVQVHLIIWTTLVIEHVIVKILTVSLSLATLIVRQSSGARWGRNY